MSENDLFPEAQGLSPRLVWLQKHALTTFQKKGKKENPWVCSSLSKPYLFTDGADENEAILNYCEVQNIKHWSLE